ncbi:MAG: sodium:calcium antiporter [Candidatus Buchananbacteria bacterium]|nr:sodium:calcium antiporter [Candidatus Buchananbacteria bacterium]
MLTAWIIVLIASLYILVKAADYFTDYAEKMGKILKLPNFIVGVLIVAIGTSLPELATSIAGVSSGEVEFLSGNVLGTIIANILFGVALTVIIVNKPLKLNWDIVSNDLPFFAAAIFLTAIALLDGKFTFIEALLFLAGYVIYVFYAYYIQKSERASIKEKYEKQLKRKIKTEIADIEKRDKKLKGKKALIKITIYLIISLIVVAIASNYVIESVINIATILGLGTSVIAATVVAIGTSLPEIFVAIVAAKKGNFDMAIGDILGSSIFDLFIIYGTVGLFTTLTITHEFFVILISFLIASFVLLWMALIDKQITRSEGWIFIIIYLMFIGKLFNIF